MGSAPKPVQYSKSRKLGGFEAVCTVLQIYREKMNTVRGWLRASSMPKMLKSKIIDYYSEVRGDTSCAPVVGR